MSRERRAVEWRSVVLCAVVVLAGAGCSRADKKPKHKHVAAPQVEAYLMALQYRDLDSLYTMHIESTASGAYCGSPVFTRALERVKERKLDATACANARALSRLDERHELDAEGQLLAQLVRFVCERPEGSCQDYSRQVFDAQLRAAPLAKVAPKEAHLQRVMGSGERAVAYVDLVYPHPVGTLRKTVGLVHTTAAWRITTPISELLTP